MKVNDPNKKGMKNFKNLINECEHFKGEYPFNYKPIIS